VGVARVPTQLLPPALAEITLLISHRLMKIPTVLARTAFPRRWINATTCLAELPANDEIGSLKFFKTSVVIALLLLGRAGRGRGIGGRGLNNDMLPDPLVLLVFLLRLAAGG